MFPEAVCTERELHHRRFMLENVKGLLWESFASYCNDTFCNSRFRSNRFPYTKIYQYRHRRWENRIFIISISLTAIWVCWIGCWTGTPKSWSSVWICVFRTVSFGTARRNFSLASWIKIGNYWSVGNSIRNTLFAWSERPGFMDTSTWLSYSTATRCAMGILSSGRQKSYGKRSWMNSRMAWLIFAIGTGRGNLIRKRSKSFATTAQRHPGNNIRRNTRKHAASCRIWPSMMKTTRSRRMNVRSFIHSVTVSRDSILEKRVEYRS